MTSIDLGITDELPEVGEASLDPINNEVVVHIAPGFPAYTYFHTFRSREDALQKLALAVKAVKWYDENATAPSEKTTRDHIRDVFWDTYEKSGPAAAAEAAILAERMSHSFGDDQ